MVYNEELLIMDSYLIDSHAHIYLKDFKDDIKDVISRSCEGGVKKILLPNINLETVPAVFSLSNKFKNICYPMLGLHPCYLKEDYKEEIDKIFANFNEKIIAIGEIGIDLFRSSKNFNNQADALRIQCSIAIKNNLPIVIHTRNSVDETIEIISEFKKQNLRGVFHCFVGNLIQAKKIIDLGFLIGVGGILTFMNSNLKNIVSQINLNNVILETDSPYLSPEPKRGKRNEPLNINFIAEKLSILHSLPLKNIIKTTSNNVNNLFKLT
jgi:TatD DNase family protein